MCLPSERLVAILGGGDWADASVNHLVVPRNINLALEKEKYEHWYAREYVPPYRRGEHPIFVDFSGWLIKFSGAREAREDEIELFNEDA